ncbi:hypothetical protein THRCLA_11360 [Thraustotheca clavata]|uniref:Uncharacterized protein n=1 Tax=Thraustotheca clavata TaxID=74557 RepID=A0A1V9Y7Z5_9STRA|nr:hypothetical protein THRCLA_11360 [Thraustotheca clavata]
MEIREWKHRPSLARTSLIHAQFTSFRMDDSPNNNGNFVQENLDDTRTFEGVKNGDEKCGVVTTTSGCTVSIVVESNGIGFGVIHQEGFIFEGELYEHEPHGYGVGTFADGNVFAGYWFNGKPQGLGQFSIQPKSKAGYGWYFNRQLLYVINSTETPLEILNIQLPRKPQEQPLLGLFTMCRILETQRLRRFQSVFDRWTTNICQQSILAAYEARILAFNCWRKAGLAQVASIQNTCNVLRRSGTDQELKSHLDTVVAHQNNVKERQALRNVRLDNAKVVLTTTTTCLGIEQKSKNLMQAELDTIEAELIDARRAKLRCDVIQKELTELRKCIENRQVDLHALRRRNQSILPPARRRHGKKSVAILPEAITTQEEILYVCGVPGCNCGVPKDVFRRASAAWQS